MTADTSLLAWIALALVVTVLPGPDTLLTAGNAARRGIGAGMASMAGVIAGGAVYVALCGFGFMSVRAAPEPLYRAVKIAGGVSLAVIGAQLLWSAFRRRPSGEAAEPRAARLVAS